VIQQLSLLITESIANIRLDKALAHHSEIRTRSRAQKLLETGSVMLQGKPVKPSRLTVLGEEYSISLPKYSKEIEPYDFPLNIHFEDEHLIVVNKPSGLVVHPAEGHENDTLVNALLHHTKSLSMGFHEKRPGIVHRLDKDTSGLLVIAKDDRTHEHLAKQFRDRTVQRLYHALIVGVPKNTSGQISNMIGRDPGNRKKFSIVKTNGKLSTTNYKILQSFRKYASLVELKLHTGRTHQIRVHMSSLGHPVMADPLYGPRRYDKLLNSRFIADAVAGFPGIALHARTLGFIHPFTSKALQFEVSEPEYFLHLKKLLETLS